ncbi:helix-turn-helix DNA-binding domain protein [Gordonia phage Dardanus]|uniref:Helix-turn-helix DNA-binding domain protein n=1 Tax=Gordonia phage Dardanus TaxID=2588489 RepID=A0A514CX36_9CAUD|nr:transcriptional repressor [Gordonia phage Dardanus]QDH85074.1 helix-turn-helix DNA-binding domain protein [Gordonia phage Dardanus]
MIETATLRIDYDEVRKAMKRNGIRSVQTLADDWIGVSLSTLNRQLCGREAPTHAVIAGLVSRLGIRYDRLLVLHDDAVPPASSKKTRTVAA